MGSDKEHPDNLEPVRRGSGAVAWVIVPISTTAGGGALAADHLLSQVTKAVRGDDRVCPVATTLVAMEFGSVASAVPLLVLGDRIARAVGSPEQIDRADAHVATAVGIAGPGNGIVSVAPNEVARRALSTARSGFLSLDEHASDGSGGFSLAVSVDQRAAGHESSSGVGPTPFPFRRRTIHHYDAGRGNGTQGLGRSDLKSGDAGRLGVPLTATSLRVLVVDPMATEGTVPGFAFIASAGLVERLGCCTATATVSPDGPLVMTVDGSAVDLVVLVLDGAWVGRSPNWATGAWGLPARLTTAYADKGVPVLAVGVGAGAGAIASCVAQGALALFDIDSLYDTIRSLEGTTVEDARKMAELGFPERFRALLALTAGERRILFYLTEGWAAQDIADELVVSLTTVRSHIRSILHKLEVRSQLAAVAIANSRDLEDRTDSANS